jgi:hypothetical protein
MEDQASFLANNKSVLRPRSQKFNIILSLVIGLGGYYFGFMISIFSITGDYFLSNNFGLADNQDRNNSYNKLNLYFGLGAIIGVLAGGVFADNIGRVKSLVFAEFIALFTYIIYYLA